MAAEDENKRIVLRIPRTNPELHAEIHKYPVDYRAKRLLYLASIGLMELVKQGMIEPPFTSQAQAAVGITSIHNQDQGATDRARAPQEVRPETAPVAPVQAAPVAEARAGEVLQSSPAAAAPSSATPVKRRAMPAGAFKSEA